MIDVAKLKTQTVKDLADQARKKGVAGWHAMRKEQLIRALVKHAKARTRAAGKLVTAASRNGHSNGHARLNGHAIRSPRVERRLKQAKAKLALSKNLAVSNGPGNGQFVKDRLVVMVRDSFWLHVYWEVTRASIERAKVAMGQNWHGAKPVLRVHEVQADGTTSSVRKVVRQVEVHGGVNNWYVHVSDPPKTYQLDIGYVGLNGKFYGLARSNVVSTPQTNPGEAFDGNWAGVAQDYDRIFALSGGYAEENNHSELRDIFEEQLRRPMGPPTAARFGLGPVVGNGKEHDFHFQIDAEMVVLGTVDSGSHVTMRGEPVKVEPDGSFKVRFHLPDRRQVLPIVASSGDGAEQRTIVLAVERNTKVMEPVVRESGE